MRALLQRVSSASVSIEGGENRSIGRGVVVLLGVGAKDSPADAQLLADKLASLRLFPTRWAFENADAPKKGIFREAIDARKVSDYDLTVSEIGGGVLIVSQVTLLADLRKGRKPDFAAAAAPEAAQSLYRAFIEAVESRLLTPAADPKPVVLSGFFGAHMSLTLANEGPLTLLLDSADLKKK